MSSSCSPAAYGRIYGRNTAGDLCTPASAASCCPNSSVDTKAVHRQAREATPRRTVTVALRVCSSRPSRLRGFSGCGDDPTQRTGRERPGYTEARPSGLLARARTVHARRRFHLSRSGVSGASARSRRPQDPRPIRHANARFGRWNETFRHVCSRIGHDLKMRNGTLGDLSGLRLQVRHGEGRLP